MALRTGDRPEATVEVLAPLDVAHRLLDVELVQPAEERQRLYGAIQEPRVDLAVLVAREHARRLLQGHNDWYELNLSCNSRGMGRLHAHFVTRSTSSRSIALCMSRIWIALSVEWTCASWSGCAPNPPALAVSAHGPAPATGGQTCLVVPAAHHELDHLLPVQRVLVVHDAQRSEAPVDRVQAQVRGEMVREVILALAQSLGVRGIVGREE